MECARPYRESQLVVRLTPAEREHIDAQAAREGVTRSEFLRRLLARAVGERALQTRPVQPAA